MKWWRGNWNKLILAVLASAYSCYYAQTKLEWHVIDSLNLIIHEAGHWIFLPLGTFMHVLGGSLFQTIFPLVYVWYFFRRYDYFAASIILLWTGINLINVSVYAGDAVAMQLPLLGGDGTLHDWNFLLWDMHLLNHTHAVSLLIYSLGIIVIATAATGSFYFSQIQKKAPLGILR